VCGGGVFRFDNSKFPLMFCHFIRVLHMNFNFQNMKKKVLQLLYLNKCTGLHIWQPLTSVDNSHSKLDEMTA
jgi:hypothetical protein